jgi:hypothetical protein
MRARARTGTRPHPHEKVIDSAPKGGFRPRRAHSVSHIMITPIVRELKRVSPHGTGVAAPAPAQRPLTADPQPSTGRDLASRA